MVAESYMLDRPPAPSVLKVFVDQRAIPMAIDMAGAVEVALHRTTNSVRQSPFTAFSLALGFGWVLALLLDRRRTA